MKKTTFRITGLTALKPAKTKSLLISFIILVFLSQNIYAYQIPKKDSKEKKLYNLAMQFIEAKEYSIALPYLIKLYRKNPDNYNLNFFIGLCYLEGTSSYKTALVYLEKAILNTQYDHFSSWDQTKAPKYAFYYLGIVYFNLREYDKSILCFDHFSSFLNESQHSVLIHEVELWKKSCVIEKKKMA